MSDIRMDPTAWGVEILEPILGQIITSSAPILSKNRDMRVSSFLFGERINIHAYDGDWALVASKADYFYVGWTERKNIATTEYSLNFHRIFSKFAPLFSGPNIKSLTLMTLPMGSGICAQKHDENFLKLTEVDGYIHKSHCVLKELQPFEWALECLGAPYLWGGGTPDGIDCSGLTQLAYSMSGIGIPRDSDQQEKWLPMIEKSELSANDLVYWKGHVGMMINAHDMIHATAFAMKTIIEPLEQTIARVGEPTGFRRPSND